LTAVHCLLTTILVALTGQRIAEYSVLLLSLKFLSIVEVTAPWENSHFTIRYGYSLFAVVLAR
jgi:hypothetical protein